MILYLNLTYDQDEYYMKVPHYDALSVKRGGHIIFDNLYIPCEDKYRVELWVSEADYWNNDDHVEGQ